MKLLSVQVGEFKAKSKEAGLKTQVLKWQSLERKIEALEIMID